MNETSGGKLLRGMRLCALVLICSSALLPVFTGGILTRFGTAQVSVLLLCGGALVGGLYVACGGEIRVPPKGLSIGGGIFLIAILVAMWRAEDKLSAYLTGSQWVSQLVMLFALVAFAWEGELQRLLTAAIGATAFVAAIHAIHQYYFVLPLVRELVESDPKAYQEISESLWLAFERRATLTRRAFGTFITPNSLGALMLLGTSISACCVWSALKRRVNRATPWLCGIVTVAAGFALLLSKSKGAWLAAILAAAVVGISALRRSSRAVKLGFSVGLCGALVLLIAAALTGVGSAPRARQFSESFLVRLDYWRGAWELIGAKALVGHGLDSFGNLYPGVKLARAHETLSAHDDFLQIWAGAGLVGLAGFLAVWGAAFAGLRHRARGSVAYAPELRRWCEGRKFPLVLSLLVLLVVGAGCVAEGREELLLFIGPLWLPAVLVLWKASADADMVRLGIGSAMVAYLIHSAVDMNAYVPGVAQPAWMVAAVAVLAGGDGRTVRAGGAAARAARVAAFVALVAVVGVISRFEVKSLLASKRIEAAQKYRGTAGPRLDEKVKVSYEAMYELERAEEILPIHQGVHGKLGALYSFLYGAGEEWHGEKKTFELAVEAYRRAAELNPNVPVYHAALGELLSIGARAVPGRWKEAAREWSEAVARYPTNPRYRFNLARALRETSEGERAASEYAKALELEGKVQHEWLVLSESERREAEAAVEEAASR